MGIIDLIFPKSCVECGKGNKYFCDSCLQKVAVLNSFNLLTKTFSVFSYSGVIRKGIIKIKYNFAYDVAKELSEIIIKELQKNAILPLKKVILIPIPLHKSRQNWRGFNQSEVVGKLVAEGMNWQYEDNILTRKKGGKTQVGLKGIDRVRNIRGKYAVNEAMRVILSEVEGKTPTYIVFDDVLTTGSTIKEAIKVLRKSGANRVVGLTIAK